MPISVNDLPTCLPSDAIAELEHIYDTDESHMFASDFIPNPLASHRPPPLTDVTSCPHDCVRNDIEMTVTKGSFDTAVLQRYLTNGLRPVNWKNETMLVEAMTKIAEESTVLQFYFDTFDYPTFMLYQKTSLDFLCKLSTLLNHYFGSKLMKTTCSK